MATIGTTEVPRPPDVPTRLWELIDSTVQEYRGDPLASNLVGVPFMARTGQFDRVISPRSTRHMASLLQQAGLSFREKRTSYGTEWSAEYGDDATVVELDGHEHWWWDTLETNDGGAMDDKQMRSFFSRALSQADWATRHLRAVESGGIRVVGRRPAIRFLCANLAACGSRAGIRMLMPMRPYSKRPPAFELRRVAFMLTLSTENVARLRIDTAELGCSEPFGLAVDGQRLTLPCALPNDKLQPYANGEPVTQDILGYTNTIAGWRARGLDGKADAHEALLERIKAWRMAEAERLRLAPKSVLPDHLAMRLVKVKPAALESLHALGVRGEGAAGLLALLERWKEEQGEYAVASQGGGEASVVLCREEEEEGAGAIAQWHVCGDEATCAATDTTAPEATALARCCAPPLRSAETGAGPIRRVLSRPFTIVYGTGASPKANDAYRKAAISFANAWASVGGGLAAVVADEVVPSPLPAGNNWIIFGGVHTNRVARVLAPMQPVPLIEREEQPTDAEASRRLEGGFRIGGCNFSAEGTGLVALGPSLHAGDLVVSVAGTTLGGFGSAVESFRSNLFDTNSWQHRLPEYLVVGPRYEKRKRSLQEGRQHNPLRGVLAAGYFGSRWEFREDAAFVDCSGE